MGIGIKCINHIIKYSYNGELPNTLKNNDRNLYLSNTYPKSILLHNVKQPLKNNFKNVFEWLFLYDKRKIKTYSPLNRDNFLLFRCLFSKHDTSLC